MPDIRRSLLQQWVASTLNEAELELEPVSGDASFRRYFRWPAQPSLIAVDAPIEHENIPAFEQTTELLTQAGVQVPVIKAVNKAQGFMLLSDFGDQLLLPQLNPTSADALYSAAIDSLIQIQANSSAAEALLPLYGEEKLWDEMDLFRDWLAIRHLGLEQTIEDFQMFDRWFIELRDRAYHQPRTLVHRDYHSRNLMLLPEQQIGIIDHQDAVWGPYSYDMVSLLKDCYIDWPRAKQLEWVDYYAQRAKKSGIVLPEREQLIKDFDWMGMQRHLKAAGIFARLLHRDNKDQYIQDIPRTLAYIVQMLAMYPEFSEIREWFEQRLMPLFKQADLAGYELS
ncbi:aminoglycoside phosphotransferase family protein [Pleionea sp. CnH1-48]|uniref:aminoglycoside phosphotransferase family protein n=1 Tax=Pleionea sp. CnH1-48 TaxID=2954494 RepID=UPI002097FD0D|nr:phosphotransferase [Pleionea sp. CnH1-48]MCO7224437.1 phosphotransferase [Pleionea sp. CnH1-48]